MGGWGGLSGGEGGGRVEAGWGAGQWVEVGWGGCIWAGDLAYGGRLQIGVNRLPAKRHTSSEISSLAHSLQSESCVIRNGNEH